MLKPSYDIWACGMTLLAAAEVTEVDSSLEEPKLFNVSDDGDASFEADAKLDENTDLQSYAASQNSV